jgi:hypothetical protein
LEEVTGSSQTSFVEELGLLQSTCPSAQTADAKASEVKVNNFLAFTIFSLRYTRES